jgi:hypothetical protein
MTMKRTHVVSLFATFAVALVLTVASAVAQQPDGRDIPSADTVRSIPPIDRGDGNLRPRTLYHTDFVLDQEDTSSQAHELIRQLEAAGSDSQRDAVKAKLTDLIGKQFDARQAHQKQEIEALEAQVKKLKGLVQKRQDNRSEIISRRLDQIIRESQGLGF